MGEVEVVVLVVCGVVVVEGDLVGFVVVGVYDVVVIVVVDVFWCEYVL